MSVKTQDAWESSCSLPSVLKLAIVTVQPLLESVGDRTVPFKEILDETFFFPLDGFSFRDQDASPRPSSLGKANRLIWIYKIS